MNILWICNSPIEPIARDLNLKTPVSNGWIVGIYNQIVKTDQFNLSIAFPLVNSKSIRKGKVENVKYYSFYQGTNIVGLPDPVKKNNITCRHINQIIKEVNPELLHVFGTEFVHSLIAVEMFNKPDKTLINIQGLTYAIADYYFADLKWNVVHKFSVSNIFRGSISKQRKKMILRGKNEIEAIKRANHVVGRTDWDKACVKHINPEINYHFCNENLRDPFYTPLRLWEYEKCEKHSIFTSQASYPLKGFHYLLQALPDVIKKYPDTKVYVAGNNPIKKEGLRNRFSMSSYGKYIDSLIRKLRLSRNIIFCDKLNQDEMVDRYLQSNVFVLPSSIENSPNSLGEAMALRVPCIASDVGGVKNLLVHENEGYIYQHNETRVLSSYIIRVFDLKENVSMMATNGYEHACKTHDRQKNCEVLIEIYEKLAKKKE